MMTTTGIVAVVDTNARRFTALEQSSSFHVDSGRLAIRRTDSGYEITTPTLTVNVDTFTGMNRKVSKRTFFDVEIRARLPKDGSLGGACGDFNGNPDNDFQGQTSGQAFVSCSLMKSGTMFQNMNIGSYTEGEVDDDGGALCGAGARFKSTAKQEARVAASSVTEVEMVVAKSCKPGSDLMKQTLAGCATFLPSGFPESIKTMGDIKLKNANKCYFVSCTSGDVNAGVAAADMLVKVDTQRQKCAVPKQERDRVNAEPPVSLALIQSQIKQGEENDLCF